jgi:hypothetical protein
MGLSTIDADVLRSYTEVVEAAAPASERKAGFLVQQHGALGDGGDASQPAGGATEAGAANSEGDAGSNVDMFYFEHALATAISSQQQHSAGGGGGGGGAPDPSTVHTTGSATTTEGVSNLTRLVVEEQKTLDLFHKLKFNWLELQTKQYFLEVLLGCPKGVTPNDLCPSDAAIAELEISSAQAKQELKKIKQQTKNLHEQMESLCTELARAHGIYLASFNECRTAVEDLCARVQERAYRDQLVERDAELASLRQQEAEMLAKKAKLEWETRPLEQSIDALREEIAAAETRLESGNSASEKEPDAALRARYQAMVAWYQAMIPLLESISGIRIERFETDRLVISMEHAVSDQKQQAVLDLVPGSCLISRITLEPPPSPTSGLDAAEIQTLLRRANETNDMGWLIRTLQQRLYLCAR